MKKIKILHLVTSLKTGGAETVLVDLIRNLNRDSFDNIVIYFYDGPNVEKLQDLGIKIHFVKGIFFRYDPIFIFRLFKLIRKIKPDLIHSLLWSANILGSFFAKILKIPIVCALHLAKNFESSNKDNYFRGYLDKLFLPKANAIIAVSQLLVDDIKRNSNWFPLHKVTVIRNGIDIESINHRLSIQNNNIFLPKINEDTFIIGSVGRFIPRKNHKMLIEAFGKLVKEIDNVHLILIGYGPLQEILEAKVKQLGIQDKVDFIQTDDAYKYYSFFDCFALTSYNEGLPLVVLEAMLFGLPCVVTNSDINHELIRDGENGYVIKDNDVEDLYKKLKELYNNKPDRERLGSNAKNAIFSNFDIKNTVKSYERIFLNIHNK